MDGRDVSRRIDVRRAGAVVFLVLGVVYALTLAPGLTWWDAGEFALAVDRFGIPHPPGAPLYVALARSWHLLLPGVPTVLASNALSAVATAAGCAVLGAWLARSLGDVRAGVAAGVAAGAMTSIWRNATETEVYALVLLAVALALAAADMAGRSRQARWRLLTVYTLALGYVLHPGVLVVAPAAAILAWPVTLFRPGTAHDGDSRASASWWRELLGALALGLLALTALGMLWVRARHDPWLNQGNPASLQALGDVVSRAQYGGSPIWPRQSPWWAQLGMVLQYLDWQFALGISPGTVPSWPRALLSVAGLVVLGNGVRWHWQRDRRTAMAVGALLTVGTLGAAFILNFKTGWSFSLGHLLDGARREARERDYFFSFGFAACGLWYGLGVRALASRVGAAAARRGLVVLVAGVLLPVVLNWPATNRRSAEAPLPHAFAERVLSELPPNAVFVATADNELFPLWYVQGAEGRRPDVLVVAEPLLPTGWYRAELARRSGLFMGDAWPGKNAMRARVMTEAAGQRRPVFESVFADTLLLEALWADGGPMVGEHAEPFSRIVAALLQKRVVVRAVGGR
ncbi:MAG TPA: DUF2723 domain-containing protein [Gemmatimonadaceae bacterium]